MITEYNYMTIHMPYIYIYRYTVMFTAIKFLSPRNHLGILHGSWTLAVVPNDHHMPWKCHGFGEAGAGIWLICMDIWLMNLVILYLYYGLLLY